MMIEDPPHDVDDDVFIGTIVYCIYCHYFASLATWFYFLHAQPLYLSSFKSSNLLLLFSPLKHPAAKAKTKTKHRRKLSIMKINKLLLFTFVLVGLLSCVISQETATDNSSLEQQ